MPDLLDYGDDYLDRQAAEIEAMKAQGRTPCARRDIDANCSALWRSTLDYGDTRQRIRAARGGPE